MRRRRRFKNPAASTYLASLGISLAQSELARVKKMPISARMAYLKRKMRSGPRWSPTTWAPRAAARNDNLIRLAAQAIGSVEMRRNSGKFKKGDKVRFFREGYLVGPVPVVWIDPETGWVVVQERRGRTSHHPSLVRKYKSNPRRRKYKRRRNSAKAPEMSAHKYGRDWRVKTGSGRFEGRTIVSGFKNKKEANAAIWAIKDAFYERGRGKKKRYEVEGRYGYYAVDDEGYRTVMTGLKKSTAKGLASVLNGIASGYGV